MDMKKYDDMIEHVKKNKKRKTIKKLTSQAEPVGGQQLEACIIEMWYPPKYQLDDEE